MRQVALHRTNALVRPERFSSRLVVFKGDMPAILNKEPAESIVERLYLIYSLLPYFQYFSILFPYETDFFGKVCGPFCSSVAIETRLNFSLNRPGPAREEDGKVFWKFKFLVSVFQVIFARVALKLFRPQTLSRAQSIVLVASWPNCELENLYASTLRLFRKKLFGRPRNIRTEHPANRREMRITWLRFT